MRRKRKDSSYLNKLVKKFRRLKAKSDSTNNGNSKTDLRAQPVI